jgi:hypothetical protein
MAGKQRMEAHNGRLATREVVNGEKTIKVSKLAIRKVAKCQDAQNPTICHFGYVKKCK